MFMILYHLYYDVISFYLELDVLLEKLYIT